MADDPTRDHHTHHHTPYHTVIIGSGPGGLTAAVGLAGFGKRVALIEKQHIGGDCTNVGCVPSKTLIHLVNHASEMSDTQILQEVQAKRNRLRDDETEHFSHIENLELIMGQARFVAKDTLEVRLRDGGSRELRARHIVIATGARPAPLAIPGLPESRVLTNESLFELAAAPKHLAIIGSGIIGMEMAFAFRKLGARVSVVSRAERVLSSYDPEVAEVIQASLREQDTALWLNAQTSHYDEASSTLHISQNQQTRGLEGVDKVLLAVGRVPNTDGLGLETLGLRFDKKGIATDSFGATNVRGVYAIGDVTPQSNYTHSANAQGRRLVRRLALPFLPALGPEPPYPNATFSDPEVASVGPSLAGLHERYHPELITTLHADLSQTDKGYTEGLTRGFVRLRALRLTGRVLSATVVAPRASEMISLLSAAVTKGLSLYSLAGLVYPYPTLSEGIKKAADSFVFATLPKLPTELGAYMRYRWAKPDRAQPTAPPRKDARATN